MKRSMKALQLSLICFLTVFTVLGQESADFVQITPSIRYKQIGIYDIDRLNAILTKEIPAATGDTKAKYSPAKSAVRLFRVEYMSVIPEQDNRPTMASGLIAIPVNAKQNMPMVSYQHGTVFGKQEVPSFPDESFETRLMIAQFASQGYVVIGADYFGMGTSKEKDSYIVLKSQVQASYDMYEAAKVILEKERIKTTDFYITGWSQGGVITMAFLEQLEKCNVKVKAAATASAQCDGYIMTNGFLNNPRKIDAPWVTTMFILTAFSFEEYYQIPGLAQGLFNPEQYEVAKKLYLKETPITLEEFPTDLHKLIRKEYFDPVYFKQSAYGKLLGEMHPYRWVVKTPVKMYYGDVDECLTTGLARLPMEYQKALGSDKIEAYSTGTDANHRITYARAVVEWKSWFDGLSK